MSSSPVQRRSGLSAAARRQAKSKKKAANVIPATAAGDVSSSITAKNVVKKELQVLILCGVSGCGKSWLCGKIVEELGADAVFVSSRDELREARYNVTDTNVAEYYADPYLVPKEGAITRDQDSHLTQIAEDPSCPYDLIIIDDTNLRIDYVIERCRAFYTGTRIKFLPIHCTREESDVNQEKRTRQVPGDKVDGQIMGFAKLMVDIRRDSQVQRYLATQLDERITSILKKWVPKASLRYLGA
jgi:hypothetical protein